ncbi:MAG: hypothetical protein ABIV94_10720 [Acidimicrobiales bacterium]
MTADDAPPLDPEDWSDEEWTAWLHATAPDDDADDASLGPARPTRGRSAVGAAMLGLHQVFYGPVDDEVVIVAPAPDGPGPQWVAVKLDPEDPKKTTVVVRGDADA